MIEIKKMEMEHVESVFQIEKLSFATPWSLDSLYEEQRRAEGRYVVALSDGEVVGYGGYWKVMDEGNINNIAVHPAWRGKKLGEKILSALFELGKKDKLTAFFLEVRVSNAPAKALYQKTGFMEAGLRKRYYEDNGEDALVMRKDMEGEFERNQYIGNREQL